MIPLIGGEVPYAFFDLRNECRRIRLHPPNCKLDSSQRAKQSLFAIVCVVETSPASKRPPPAISLFAAKRRPKPSKNFRDTILDPVTLADLTCRLP
ncbi:MAG: hypothetical protein GF363_08695 [Chitinivibrionales bacterium]|nr:hypothetical protein [Chitinivibrionales bacterium]